MISLIFIGKQQNKLFIHFFLDIQQHLSDIIKGFNDFEIINGIFPVILQFFLGALKSHPPFFHKMVNNMEIINILPGKKPVTFFIFLWLYNIKLSLPEPGSVKYSP